MNRTRMNRLGYVVAMLAGMGLASGIGCSGAEESETEGQIATPSQETSARPVPGAYDPRNPTRAAGPGDIFYPGTEDIGPDEMRLSSCGTGMPNQRPSQKATCWLLELGNGDKFLFDIGTGSSDNISMLRVPYDYLNKVFLSHLHADHIGDLDALYVGGLISGRVEPLHVYGPTGSEPRLGTAAAVTALQAMLAWDVEGRAGRLPASGQVIEVHEFPWEQRNEIVYQQNGVTVRSWPAIHVLDGAVSYSLEWNDFKFVFGGDTYPNSNFIEFAKDADVSIHEAFMPVPNLVERINFPVDRALEVGTQIHTAPPAFGRVMALTEPRHAIAYHFFNDFDTAPMVYEGIRQTYDGPLSLAHDMMVWNITRDDVRVRRIIGNEDQWPPPPAQDPPAIDHSIMKNVSDELQATALDIGDIIQGIYDRANERYGTDFSPRVSGGGDDADAESD